MKCGYYNIMKSKTKRRLSPARKAIVAVLSVLLAITTLFLGIRIGEMIAFAPFFGGARGEFDAPFANGFVAQGLDYIESTDTFLTCGYSAKKGQPSMVYNIDRKGNRTLTKLLKADGSNYTGHTGGIAHYGDYAYITGADGCDVFNLADFTDKKPEARAIGCIKSPEGHDPAFVTVHEDKLYEGTFYRSGNYETPDNERITTPCGDNNTALIYVYQLGDNENFGVSQKPIAAYSVRGLVQGMTFTGNQIVLSCSWGLSSSHLYFYDISAIPEGQLTLDGENIPLKYLDGSCLTRTVTAPPMSEEIVYLDGRIFIMTESASDKYIFGKFMSGVTIFSIKA